MREIADVIYYTIVAAKVIGVVAIIGLAVLVWKVLS